MQAAPGGQLRPPRQLLRKTALLTRCAAAVAYRAQRQAPSWLLCSPALSQVLSTRLRCFWHNTFLALPLAVKLESKLPDHSLVQDSGWLDWGCCKPHDVTALEMCAQPQLCTALNVRRSQDALRLNAVQDRDWKSGPQGH